MDIFQIVKKKSYYIIKKMLSILISNILLCILLIFTIASIIFYYELPLITIKSIQGVTLDKDSFTMDDIINGADSDPDMSKNAKSSLTALIVISSISGAAILLNLINNFYNKNSKKAAVLMLVISAIAIRTMGTFGINKFRKLKLEKSQSTGTDEGGFDERNTIVFQASYYLTFGFGILVSLYNIISSSNFIYKVAKA